jgi:hypothetical protein
VHSELHPPTPVCSTRYYISLSGSNNAYPDEQGRHQIRVTDWGREIRLRIALDETPATLPSRRTHAQKMGPAPGR